MSARLGRIRGLGRRGRIAVVFAMVTASVFVTATASAYWTASPVTATGTAGATTLRVTATGAASLTTTYTNQTALPAVMSAAFTVTNTTVTSSTTVPQVAITLGYAGDATLAAATTVSLWSTTTPSSCTTTVPTSGVTTTTLAAGASATVGIANNGAAVSWCVVTSLASLQSVSSTGGSRSVTPTLTASTSVGNFTSTATSTGTQTTSAIYPGATMNTVYYSRLYPVAYSGLCQDIRASGGAGTDMITYPCKTTTLANQVFRFASASTSGYFTISPQHISGLNLDDNSSTTSGSSVQVQAASTSKSQQWLPEQVSTGVYQFVNLFSGMCLTAVPIGSLSDYPAATQTPCTGSTAQEFQTAVPPLVSVACSNTGGLTAELVSYGWESAQNGGYVVQAQNAAGTWVQIASTTATTSTGASVPGSLPSGSAMTGWAQGNYAVRILDGAGNVVFSAAAGATGSINVTSTWLVFSYPALRCN